MASGWICQPKYVSKGRSPPRGASLAPSPLLWPCRSGWAWVPRRAEPAAALASPKTTPALARGLSACNGAGMGCCLWGAGCPSLRGGGGSASPQPLFAITRELLLVPSPGVSVLHSPPRSLAGRMSQVTFSVYGFQGRRIFLQRESPLVASSGKTIGEGGRERGRWGGTHPPTPTPTGAPRDHPHGSPSPGGLSPPPREGWEPGEPLIRRDAEHGISASICADGREMAPPAEGRFCGAESRLLTPGPPLPAPAPEPQW